MKNTREPHFGDTHDYLKQVHEHDVAVCDAHVCLNVQKGK